jgi:hypothetical protein
MWYKVKIICIKKWKFCIVVNFFIWIIIKNYWYDIKNEKNLYVLMLIVIKKCKNKIKKNTFPDTSTTLSCSRTRRP